MRRGGDCSSKCLPAELCPGLSCSRGEAGAWLIGAEPELVKAGSASSLVIPSLRRYLALRCGDYWMTPHWGTELAELADEVQFLVCELADGSSLALAALVAGEVRASFAGAPTGLKLVLQADRPVTGRVPVVAVGQDVDPCRAVERAVALAARQLGTFRLRIEKPPPRSADWLGWCTWDAFYNSVDQTKVLAGLDSFAAAGVRPGFCIIDDGWCDTQGDLLRSFTPDVRKFPDGLAGLAAAVRARGIQVFGVWHCFEGYWAGIDPQGPLARRYRLVRSRGVIRPWEQDPALREPPLYLVHTDDVPRFWNDWYQELHRAGVDFVKSDGQSAINIFSSGAGLPRVTTMRAWQRAAQRAAAEHFGGSYLHCMSHSNEVYCNMWHTSLWRNSNDYFPQKPRAAQQQHVRQNAAGALFCQSVALPDWDMFQTHGPDALFHAAARAISGGPVYVCDLPHHQDRRILRRLATAEGRVFRPERPAVPTADCVFCDWGAGPRLLKLRTRAGRRHLLGVFNCCELESKRRLNDTWRATDAELSLRGRLAVYSAARRRLAVVKASQINAVSLPPAGWDILTLAPIVRGLAVLGCLDLLAGAAAVASEEACPGGLRMHANYAGTFGFYAAHRPARVLVDGRVAHTVKYEPETGLLRVKVSAEKGAVIEVIRGHQK